MTVLQAISVNCHLVQFCLCTTSETTQHL